MNGRQLNRYNNLKIADDKYIDGLVSIIIPVYNAGEFLISTVESILRQTYDNYEIIMVDDKSTDNSKEIIKSYDDKFDNVRPLYLEENAGVSNARNEGIKNARGRYLAFLDSDDMWEDDKLERQLEFMKRNNYHFTYTGYSFVDDMGNSLNSVVIPKARVDYNELLKTNVIPCLTVIIDRYYIDDIVMPSIRHEDYACWLSILKRGHEAHALREPLARYRTRANSLSGNKLKAASWTWNILRNVEKLPLHTAIYYFMIYATVNINKHFIKK